MKFLRLVFPSSFFRKNQLKKSLESNVSVDKQNEQKKSSESNVSIPKKDEPKQSLGDNVVSLAEQKEMEHFSESKSSMPKQDEMEQSLGNNVSVVEQLEMEQSFGNNISLAEQNEMVRSLGNNVSVAEWNEMGQPLGNNVSVAEQNEMEQSLGNNVSVAEQSEMEQSLESMPEDAGVTVTPKPMENITNETFIENPTFLGVIQNSSRDLDESSRISSGFNITTGLVANTTPADTGKKTKKKKKKNQKSRKKQKDIPPGTVNLPDCTGMTDYQTPTDGMQNPIYDEVAPKYNAGCSKVIPKSERSTQFSKIGDDGFVDNDLGESSDVVVMKDKRLACKTVDDAGNTPDMSGLLSPQCTEGYQIEQSMDKSQIIDHEMQSVEHIPLLESPESVHEGDHDLSISKHIPELSDGNDGRVSCLGETGGYSASNNLAAENSKCIGAEKAVQTLNSAYMLQLASNSFQFVTGSQIAEFERLLFSVSPVIFHSFVSQHGWESIGNEPTSIPCCKLKNLKVKLQDVWSWYDEFSCFGLGLNVEVPQNITMMGMVTTAHFCPLLSAVQLFACSRQSLLGSSSQVNISCEMPGRSGTAQNAFLTVSCPEPAADVPLSDVLDSMAKYMRPVDIASSSGKNCSISNSPLDTFDVPELIFEFFEHQRPHERKPLYEKIKELSKNDTYNPQVYGDPSKLVHMDLQDLHPASWFAVAWYPIYTIPRQSANLRAAFLTYHSFGHLVLRHIKSDVLGDNNAFCAVSPALGMQAYNAKDEGWLDVNIPPESLVEEGINLDSTRIVEERLRTLQVTAAVYSTGDVRKNQKIVSNRHQDFEFFSSRGL